jgi:hypothetical protein
VTMIDLAECNPQLGEELDGASNTQRLIGDSQWPRLVHEAVGGSSSASLGGCSIFLRVCPGGDAAFLCGSHERDLLHTLKVDPVVDGAGERSIFNVRLYDLRNADIDAALANAKWFAMDSSQIVTLHEAQMYYDRLGYTEGTADHNGKVCEGRLESIDEFMELITIHLVDGGVGPLARVRLPTLAEEDRIAARHRPAHAYASAMGTYVQTPIVAQSSTPESTRRRWGPSDVNSRISDTDRALPSSAAYRQSKSSGLRWLDGAPGPYPSQPTTMVATPTPVELAPSEPLIDRATVQQAPPQTSTSSLTPIVDTHRPTPRRLGFDEVAASLPQPPVVVPPPMWATCAYGQQHDDLNRVYSWLRGHCKCDECSVMSFFLLLQYNPDGYDACIDIVVEIKETEDRETIQNHSAVLASAVEKARKRVYPDGGEHKGKHSIDVQSDSW